MAVQLDFLVIGDDEPSLCAAACAARAGAAVGLVRAAEKKKTVHAATSPGIPNDVWRRLDLHEYDLELDPISAQVSLLPDEVTVSTHKDVRETQDALDRAGIRDYGLWADFMKEVRDLSSEAFVLPAVSGAPREMAAKFAEVLSDPKAIDRVARLAGTAHDMLDDVFEEERLKNHLAAHILAPTGLGGVEAGSVYAMLDWSGEDAWRVRPKGGAKALRAALAKACEKSGVEFYAGPVMSPPSRNSRYKTLTVNGHDKLKARYVFFATPMAAEQAGVSAAAPGVSFSGGRSADVVMRFKLSEMVKPPSADHEAHFQIIDSAADLRRARDAVLSGKLPEKLPVEFDFTEKGDILARTSYCPASFCEEGEWRSWTSQDRQAVAARIKERLLSRMPSLAETIRSTRIEVSVPPEDLYFQPSGHIIVQPGRHNTIAAAVKLIDKVMNGDH